MDDIAKAMDENLQVDAATLDFSKAFDEVAHSRLLYKLEYYGIRENLHNWLMGLYHLPVKLHLVFIRADGPWPCFILSIYVYIMILQ